MAIYLGRLFGTPAVWLVIVATLAIKVFVPVEAQVTTYRQENWMEFVFAQDPQIKNKLLSDFHFPGSHDAGAYRMRDVFACDKCTNVEKLTTTPLPGDAGPLDFVQAACAGIRAATLAVTFVPVVGPVIAAGAAALVLRYAGEILPACLELGPSFTGRVPPTIYNEILEPFAKAHSTTIYQQLVDGSRWFDLRFFRASVSDSEVPPLEEGKFYIHHTIAGPDSEEIFGDIARFLALGHTEEIFFLRLKQLQGETMDRNVLMDQLLSTQVMSNTIGDYIAPRSLDSSDPATINKVLESTLCAANCQVIVTMGEDDRNELNDIYKDLVWNVAKDNRGLFPYPNMKTIGSPRKMFKRFSETAERRDVSPGTPTKRSLLQAQVGVSEDFRMIIDKIVCDDLLESERELGHLAAVGLCTNPKYDTFQNLEDVAEWTNSIMVPALLGMPKDQINIVHVDHYRPWITDEFVRFNLKVARVVTEVIQVTEQGCHDCTDFGFLGIRYHSRPDYYPLGSASPLTFFNGSALTEGVPYSNFGAFGGGGPYLEKTGRTITPNWQDIRGFGDDVNSALIKLGIWDNDFGFDVDLNQNDHSDIAPGIVLDLFQGVVIRQCILDESNCRVDSGQVTVGTGKQDSSEVRYAINVCEWSNCTELFPTDDEPSLAYLRIFRGSDRVDKEDPRDKRPAVLEGETVVLRGLMTDVGPNDAFDVVVDWGDATSMDSIEILPSDNRMEFEISHTYFDDPPGNMTDFIVSVNVTGAALTEAAEDSRLVEVQNVDPTSSIDSFTNELGLVISEMDRILCFVLIFLQVDITVSFGDVGVNDTHKLDIDWSDGTVDMISGLDPSLSPVTKSHTYNISDHLTIFTTVTDDDGGISVSNGNLHVFTTVQGIRKMIDVLRDFLVPSSSKSVKGSKVAKGGKNNNGRRLQSKSSTKSSSYHIGKAIEYLEGNAMMSKSFKSASGEGAIGLLLKGKQTTDLKDKQKYYSSALRKIANAIEEIQKSVGSVRPFPTNLQNIMLQLVLIAKSATVELIDDARSVTNTGADLDGPSLSSVHSSRSSRSTSHSVLSSSSKSSKGAAMLSCSERLMLAESYVEEGDRVRLFDEVDAVDSFYYKAMVVLCFPK